MCKYDLEFARAAKVFHAEAAAWAPSTIRYDALANADLENNDSVFCV